MWFLDGIYMVRKRDISRAQTAYIWCKHPIYAVKIREIHAGRRTYMLHIHKYLPGIIFLPLYFYTNYVEIILQRHTFRHIITGRLKSLYQNPIRSIDRYQRILLTLYFHSVHFYKDTGSILLNPGGGIFDSDSVASLCASYSEAGCNPSRFFPSI